MEDVGGHWEDHPIRDQESMDPGRRSARGGSQGRRCVVSRNVNELMEDMELNARGGRSPGGEPSRSIALLDSIYWIIRQARAGGRGIDHEPGSLNISDLPMLRESRAWMAEILKNSGSRKERLMLDGSLNMLREDIARLEYGQREIGNVLHGMRPPKDSIDSNPRPSRALGRVPRETSPVSSNPGREPLETSDLPVLKAKRAEMMRTLKFYVESGNDGGRRMTENNIDLITADLDYLEQLQLLDTDSMSSRMERLSRRRARGDYIDEEFEYQPNGLRRGNGNSGR